MTSMPQRVDPDPDPDLEPEPEPAVDKDMAYDGELGAIWASAVDDPPALVAQLFEQSKPALTLCGHAL